MSNGLKVRIVNPSMELHLLEGAAGFIKEHSWGADYPYDPAPLLAKSEFLALGFLSQAGGKALVSMACVTCFQGNPANYDDTNPYFCCWATHSGHRGKGVGTLVYRVALDAARGRLLRPLFATTDNDETTQFLVSRQKGLYAKRWMPMGPGLNEDKSAHTRLRLDL